MQMRFASGSARRAAGTAPARGTVGDHTKGTIAPAPLLILLLCAVLQVLCPLTVLGDTEHQETKAAARESTREATTPPAVFEETEEIRILRMENITKEALLKIEERKCEAQGLVRYHGQCMTENEKTVMFEAEIVRVGRLIDAAVAMYRTATPEDVASVFHEYEELMAQFEADRFVDERIAKKTIVLLGFLYLSADTVLQQIKSELNNLESSQDPFSFMRTQLKLARFSEDTYTPIANALALHIRAFIDQRGEERFETFMRENRLDGVLRKLE